MKRLALLVLVCSIALIAGCGATDPSTRPNSDGHLVPPFPPPLDQPGPPIQVDSYRSDTRTNVYMTPATDRTALWDLVRDYRLTGRVYDGFYLKAEWPDAAQVVSYTRDFLIAYRAKWSEMDASKMAIYQFHPTHELTNLTPSARIAAEQRTLASTMTIEGVLFMRDGTRAFVVMSEDVTVTALGKPESSALKVGETYHVDWIVEFYRQRDSGTMLIIQVFPFGEK